VLIFSDHLLDQLAPVPAMATVAAATEKLRVGTFVLNNDLRHPVVLAQELASLDLLSEGRLEIGIGAGWNQPEYEQSGIAIDPIGKRISRMEEAITVLKGLFADGPFSFRGKHYTVTDMEGGPKPVQKPHPPFPGRRRWAPGARHRRPRGTDRGARPEGRRCRRSRRRQRAVAGNGGEDRLDPGGRG